jgi:hypothetical protein
MVWMQTEGSSTATYRKGAVDSDSSRLAGAFENLNLNGDKRTG